MQRKSNYNTIKNYFDETSADETFLSPTSDASESGFDFSASRERQPLASSSQRVSKHISTKSTYKPKPKSKRESTKPPEESLPRGRTLRSSQQSSNQSQQKRMTEESISRRKQRKPKKLVLKEIRKFQNTTDLLIPKLPFSRVIREILLNPNISSSSDLRITARALEALQESAEIYLTIYFEDAYRCTIHRNRVTLIVKDMELVRFLRGVNDLGYVNPR